MYQFWVKRECKHFVRNSAEKNCSISILIQSMLHFHFWELLLPHLFNQKKENPPRIFKVLSTLWKCSQKNSKSSCHCAQDLNLPNSFICVSNSWISKGKNFLLKILKGIQNTYLFSSVCKRFHLSIFFNVTFIRWFLEATFPRIADDVIWMRQRGRIQFQDPALIWRLQKLLLQSQNIFYSEFVSYYAKLAKIVFSLRQNICNFLQLYMYSLNFSLRSEAIQSVCMFLQVVGLVRLWEVLTGAIPSPLNQRNILTMIYSLIKALEAQIQDPAIWSLILCAQSYQDGQT